MGRYIAVPSEQQRPPRPCDRPGGVADERSVDVDEPRDQQPDDGSRTRPPVAAAVALSPVQQAWGRYVHHATACVCCRDVDRGRCETAEMLYRAWREGTDQAYRQLGGDTKSLA